MSGQWPPEWDDPADLPGEADQHDTEAEAGLSEVAAYLASVPAPVMPGGVEARISAALAVEAAARAGIAAPASGDAAGGGTAQSPGSVQPDRAAGARVLGPAPARARVRRRGVRERRRQRDVREILGKFVIGPLAVCLLIAVIAFGLSRTGSSSSSSSANSLAGAPAAGAASPAAAGGKSDLPGSSAAASAPMAVPSPASSAAASTAGFAVIESGTMYQRSTLTEQARAQVLANKAQEPGPAGTSSSSTSSVVRAAPTAQLRACVLKVTGGVLPELVDKATYQGTPAYVIASSSRVWVVGLGCTEARPQVIVSVPAAG
jgi:hypothetical protein